MDITTETISSLEDFIKISSKYPEAYYRGHANGEKWTLIPSIARNDKIRNNFNLGLSGGWLSLENHLLNRFKRHATPYLKIIPESKIDWLCLGQHYGLSTRLLDWTENPLIALFFALSEESNTESNVWIIEPTFIWQMDINLDYMETIQIFFPKFFDNRIISQKGCFTIQPLPKDDNKFVPIEEQLDNLEIGINNLSKIIIPNDKNVKQNIFQNLIAIGIDYNLIYPDLTGLCKQIDYELNEDITKF